ncbi:MAG: helix-turn-helix domain-containing protein [Myxococcota bacterium]
MTIQTDKAARRFLETATGLPKQHRGSGSYSGRAYSIGQIVGQSTGRASGVKVRRHSHKIGCEAAIWRSTTRKEMRRVYIAARRYEREYKEAGRRNGPLGGIALEVLDYLTNLIDPLTGRLEPSIAYLMTKLRRSRDAIWRGLAALRRHGFLSWMRRYEPTGHDGRGPQVRQTSNAYKISLPEKARKLLWQGGRDAPVGDDVAHRQQGFARALQDYRQSLSLKELPLFDTRGDNPLDQALSRLGAMVEERESAKRTESGSKIYLYRDDTITLENSG